MRATQPRPPHPYWHADAKWVAGLLLCAVLGATLLIYNLVQATAEGPAVDTLSTTIALLFSQQDMDDEAEIAQFRQRLQASPGEAIRPIPGLRITVREADLAGLSAREARMMLYRQLAEPIYRGGVNGLDELADGAEMQTALAEGGVGPLGLLSANTHQQLRRVLTVLAIACAGLTLLLILFSHRFGRLASPGVVIMATSLPGLALSGLMSAIPSLTSPRTSGEGAGMADMAGYLASNLLPSLAAPAYRTYQLVFLAGLALFGLSILGGLFWRLVRRGTA